jgi:hypothetical protein
MVWHETRASSSNVKPALHGEAYQESSTTFTANERSVRLPHSSIHVTRGEWPAMLQLLRDESVWPLIEHNACSPPRHPKFMAIGSSVTHLVHRSRAVGFTHINAGPFQVVGCGALVLTARLPTMDAGQSVANETVKARLSALDARHSVVDAFKYSGFLSKHPNLSNQSNKRPRPPAWIIRAMAPEHTGSWLYRRVSATAAAALEESQRSGSASASRAECDVVHFIREVAWA